MFAGVIAKCAKRPALASNMARAWSLNNGVLLQQPSAYHTWLDTHHNAPPKDRTLLLHDLRDNAGARKKKKRVGRGPGSGMGKTSRRGHKGTYARSGGSVSPWFQGGQTPLFKRVPKIGLRSTRKDAHELSLGHLMKFVQEGRVDPRSKIDLHTLNKARVCGVMKGVKLVSEGEELVTVPLTIECTHATEEAVEAVERAGGSVKFVYMSRVALKAHLYPHKVAILPRRLPLPHKPRKAQVYVEQIPDVYSDKPGYRRS